MTEKEYLIARIKELEKNISNSSLPMRIRLNQAHALEEYKYELQKFKATPHN